jgi:hypothetical protein
MASSNSILQKVQQAARNYVRAAAFDWVDSDSIQSGISRGPAGDDMDSETVSTPLPSIVCQCARASAVMFPNSGDWEAELAVHLRESAHDTTEDEHLAHFGALVDLFLDTEDAVAALSELADFTCAALTVNDQACEFIGKSWRSTLTVNIRCHGSDTT